jgi:hypothetical protein
MSKINWADEPINDGYHSNFKDETPESTHFRKCIQARDPDLGWLDGGPGAGWGTWRWRVHSSTIHFSPGVREACFRLAAVRALDHIRPGYGSCLSWVDVGTMKDAQWFEFRVGYLYGDGFDHDRDCCRPFSS